PSPACFCNMRWMRAPSLARSKPAKRLSMSPVWSKNSTSWRTAKRICCMVSPSLLWLRFQPDAPGAVVGDLLHRLEIDGGAVVAFQLIVTGFGAGHQVHRLLDQFLGSPRVEAQPRPEAGQVAPVPETAAPHRLLARQHGGVPAVVGDEGQPQGGDQDMVDLVFRVKGAGAGDDIIPAGQRLGANLFQQKAGGRAVLVPKDHCPVGQSPDGAAVI